MLYTLAVILLVAWLLGIALNLLSTGMFRDLAVRDVEIAIAAYALARLTEVRQAFGRFENAAGR